MHPDIPLTPVRARFLGRWVGLLFLITYATSIPALLLFGPVLNDAHYVTGAGSDTQIRFAALLEFILIVANIGSAVVLYPLLRRRFPVGAVGFVAARITESAFIGIGILSVLSVVSLRASGSDGAALPVVAEALVALLRLVWQDLDLLGLDGCIARHADVIDPRRLHIRAGGERARDERDPVLHQGTIVGPRGSRYRTLV